MTRAPDRLPSVVLVHHADAVGPDVDPQRPLSSLGRAQSVALATRACESGIRPDAIWHSGKLRARQTAEAFYRTCNPSADFRMMRGLRPDDPPGWMRDMLDGDNRDLLLVSHMPLLPALLRALTGEAADFPLNGFVVLERDGEGRYAERCRAR
jgi:phosphohistidine phosphatase